MARYIVYIPGSDSVMMDGGEPYIADEKEVRRVIAEETCHPRSYEAKPVSFLKKWQERQDEEERERVSRPYRFSPTYPELRYQRPEGQKRYLLIIGDEFTSKSGTLVKDFDTREDAVKLANKSIAKLAKQFPNLAYFILDTESHGYTDRVSAGPGT